MEKERSNIKKELIVLACSCSLGQLILQFKLKNV